MKYHISYLHTCCKKCAQYTIRCKIRTARLYLLPNTSIPMCTLPHTQSHYTLPRAHTDIRELVQVDDVMEDEDLKLVPNGGLIFCME